MSSIDNFLSEVYSEELHQFTEAEYDEVMAASAVDYDGYEEWSEGVENFQIINGQLRYKGEGQKRGPFVGGIEV